jgi:hypothetical protein
MRSEVEGPREISCGLCNGMESLASPHSAAVLQPRLRSELMNQWK